MTTKQFRDGSILENLMDRQEFADAMNITPRSADRWAWRRKGPPRFKIGTRVYYDRADVETYVQNLKRKASDGCAYSGEDCPLIRLKVAT